jgi:hypothetical protein
VEISPDSIFSQRALAACYAQSGRIEEAKAAATEVLRIRPNYKARNRTNKVPDFKKETATRWYNAQIMAGLPSE